MMKSTGKRLQELRESKNLSQSDLANYLGISQPLLSQIEAGNRNLNLTLLDTLCSLFCCSKEYILCQTDDFDVLKFSFRSKNAAIEDLDAISAISKIISNIQFLEEISQD